MIDDRAFWRRLFWISVRIRYLWDIIESSKEGRLKLHTLFESDQGWVFQEGFSQYQSWVPWEFYWFCWNPIQFSWDWRVLLALLAGRKQCDAWVLRFDGLSSLCLRWQILWWPMNRLGSKCICLPMVENQRISHSSRCVFCRKTSSWSQGLPHIYYLLYDIALKGWVRRLDPISYTERRLSNFCGVLQSDRIYYDLSRHRKYRLD